MTKELRKNHSIKSDISNDLAMKSLMISREIKRTVSKQLVIEVLISLLNDEKVFNKVLLIIKKYKKYENS